MESKILESRKNKAFSRKPQNIMKYIIGFTVCFILRLIPFRPPNVEPIMATTMPFSKKWGWLAGGFFGMVSILLYDLIHPTPGFGRFGTWTIVTAVMYGIVGIASGLYMKKLKKAKVKHYVGFAVIATLGYDFITGPIMSSIIWKMPFMTALTGQIPFTLWHLGGNIVFSMTISPLLYKWVINNKQLELDNLLHKFAVAQ